MGIHVAFIDSSLDTNGIDTQNYTVFGSRTFNIKLQWKLNILMASLQCNVNVLYLDSDVFLLKNPFSYLSQYKNVDFVAQGDISVCTGFMYFWPTEVSIRMLEVARSIRWLINGNNQDAVISVLKVIKEIKYIL